MTDRPALIFDNVTAGLLTVFGPIRAIIRADRPDEVAVALDALESARRSGNYVAGYFSYEAGYVLEPRLAPLMPYRPGPLLWFGVFDLPVTCDAEALQGWQRGRAYAGPLTPEWDAHAYAKPFRRVRDLIAAGDFYQANLTFRARFAFAGDPLALYATLRPASAARYGAYVDDGERQILSLSPELFFAIAADGTITTKPMKGTAARGSDPQADTLASAALAASDKNRAENLMIVDLLRNDLGRIAQLGSVAVPDLFTVETYPTLHQMVSTVTARLKPATGIPELVRALFPCGSITGAPKIRAMETIAELERSPRGVYCGAIGFFAPDGSARFNVAIRTLTIANGRGELGIGGGIVQDSDCPGEYAEALLKARYYETARRPLELIETLRWSAEEGFVRRDLHLARMAASAEFFGLRFDRARALDVLHNALPPPCGEVEMRSISGGGPSLVTGAAPHPDRFALRPPRKGEVIEHLRLRLTLDETGEIACTTARLGPAKDVWIAAISPQRVSSTDTLARHKTNWREPYDLTPPPGVDELLFLNERGELVEGARTNIFVARDGVLLTPPLSAGALDGVLRRALLAEGRAVEATLTPADLSGEFTLGNSLRGLIRGRLSSPAGNDR